MKDTRSSVYLVERARTLHQALDFFLSGGTARSPGYKRKLVFLGQIDFWDFEIESLIYCFRSFDHRSIDWDDEQAVQEKIMKKNFMIKNKFIHKFVENAGYQKFTDRLNGRKNSRVEAPDDGLDGCIGIWNKLLDACEEMMASEKTADAAEYCGCRIERNLDKYRKST